MAQKKQRATFSDGKLFWMAVLALLLSLASLVITVFYIYQKTQIERVSSESEMKFMTEMYQLKVCYENDVKPCNVQTLQEFNQKNLEQGE